VRHVNFPITKSTSGKVGLAGYLYSEECLKLPTSKRTTLDLHALIWPEVQGPKPAWATELSDILDEYLAAGEEDRGRKPARKRARSTAEAPAGAKRVRARGDSLLPVPEAPGLRERDPSPDPPPALTGSKEKGESSGGGGGFLLIAVVVGAFLMMR